MMVEKTLQLPPLSLYVHVPWCVRKCPYCDFNSHTYQGSLPQDEYLAALLADFDQEADFVQGRRIGSIFIGGGTPSLMSGGFYQQLLRQLRQRVEFADDIEITLEANPGTFEQQKFADYREAGINRLSLGVQSFSDQRLQALGRIHSGSEAYKALTTAAQIGFERINIDLMHGLPGQSLEQAMDDLKRGIDLGVSHLSWYQLTIEPNTEFHARPPSLPEDELLWSIQEQGQTLLAEAGLQQYEISAYASPDQQSRHNLNYWRFGDYLGIGAGAHGKVTVLDGQQLLRRWKVRQPKAYMARMLAAGEVLSGQEQISDEAIALEFMMNVLRLHGGVESSLFTECTGKSMALLEPGLQRARDLGLMARSPQRLAPTEQGRRYLNDLLELFV